MNILKINLKNCYGIQSLDYSFDFSSSNNRKRAYAIYAPNGLMKTSFSRTFDAIALGSMPKEERYNRPSMTSVEIDGVAISKEVIYVLKSEIDISSDSPAITDILVNPQHKSRYDELVINIDKQKNKLISSLQKSSKVKKIDIEQTLLNDWQESDFASCIEKIKMTSLEDDLRAFEYAIIFDSKALEVLQSPEFITKASEFNDRYQELFSETGTIYRKGIFNPTKAETAFTALNKQGFFLGGHRVHLSGESESIDSDQLDKRLQAIHAKIDGDEALKRLRTNLAKNAQTQALTDLIENLSPSQVEFLLDKLKKQNQAQFRKELWVYYIQANTDADEFLTAHSISKAEIESIETLAAQNVPRWTDAINLFNNRFVDMPFTLAVANQTQTALGIEKARLKFIFKDGVDEVEWSRSEIKTLSQGEKRALYLLNFIFEVEARKLNNEKTLFIIDDVADSFDYKNKHAIVQYLRDLNKTDSFCQIILTHNFDFFRTLSLTFVHRDRCLMANRGAASISLTKAEGVNNYFIGKWKENVTSSDCILCATIPFTRNLIEYTKSVSDPDYLKLTSLLHWKSDTEQITVGNYLEIYNNLFSTPHDTTNIKPIKDLLFEKASEICVQGTHTGLNLEDKVVLSMAIRLQSEVFLINKIRILKNDPSYWCTANNQFGKLINELEILMPSSSDLRTLEKVSITVSSNIHLNSFMYEPILDLSIEHLIQLYNEVCALQV